MRHIAYILCCLLGAFLGNFLWFEYNNNREVLGPQPMSKIEFAIIKLQLRMERAEKKLDIKSPPPEAIYPFPEE